MDRVFFVPGDEARAELENAEGRITAERKAAQDYADEFVYPYIGDSTVHIYQTMLAMLGNGEEVEILFGLRDAQPGEEFPSGERPGFTTAKFHENGGSSEVLWEVGRQSSLLDDAWARYAFDAYRVKLRRFLESQGRDLQNGEAIRDTVHSRVPPTGESTTISRCLSPTSLYGWSDVMFYYVDIAAPPGSVAHEPGTRPVLSRPMRAFDALILCALLTLVYRRPPLVFGVVQNDARPGGWPTSYRRITHIGDDGAWPRQDVQEVSIVI